MIGSPNCCAMLIDDGPMAMMRPPCCTNSFSFGIVVAALTEPTHDWNSAGITSAPARPPPPPPPPPRPPRPPAAVPGIEFSGKISTSNFERRFPASSSCGYTTRNGISNCSISHRIWPLGIDPPYRSHSPMRAGESLSELPVMSLAEAKSTPRSAADFDTTGVLFAFDGM